MLYSLPLAITLTTVVLLERHFLQKNNVESATFTWLGTWLPLVLTILFSRAIIFALPKPQTQGLYGALLRFAAHTLLCFAGWLLYTWAIAHSPLAGLPPLHHWWAKVLMYLNLCLMVLHVLPLPNQIVGELIRYFYKPDWLKNLFSGQSHVPLYALCLISVSPFLDNWLGGPIVFPIYELLASLAT
ncbi:MAG: hypothetical protein R8M46_09365 [Ghiorsea sp.]